MATNRIIDVHTHLFNGFYVPIEEIINAHALPRGMAIAFGKVLRELIGKSTSDSEDGKLGWLGLRDAEADPETVAGALINVIQRQLEKDIQRDKAEDTAKAAEDSKLYSAVKELAGEQIKTDQSGYEIDLFDDNMTTAFTFGHTEAAEVTRLDLLRRLMGLFRKIIIKMLKGGGWANRSVRPKDAFG